MTISQPWRVRSRIVAALISAFSPLPYSVQMGAIAAHFRNVHGLSEANLEKLRVTGNRALYDDLDRRP